MPCPGRPAGDAGVDAGDAGIGGDHEHLGARRHAEGLQGFGSLLAAELVVGGDP